MDNTGKMKKAICTLAGIVVLPLIFFLCGCSVSDKNDLLKYARKNYGACEFINDERKGKGNDETYTVYLRDKDTGIEYKVTSGLDAVGIDGSIFGYSEGKSSDFYGLYIQYLFDETDADIRKLEAEYNMDFEFKYDVIVLNFSMGKGTYPAEDAAKGFDEILRSVDIKNMRPKEYLLYAGADIYLGVYNTSSGEYKESNDQSIIGFVQTNYDPQAVYQSSMGAYISQFLSYDEIDRLFPDHDGAPMGTAYYFRDKDGDIFVAIDLKEFGASKSDIRLFRDTSSGMEEILY
ncbi:MAG: hypothetical protein K5665_05550 [Saccharofermentans sp.]|nr:hypothetical protein [Saccharofermentans sp.]